jgi:nucleotide-binding universal stress UspA family protein
MFKHLLVPLDGSHLAEVALPMAAYLADRLGATVTLVHIIERSASAEVHGERHLTSPQEADAYLAEAASRAFTPPQPVERHVHSAEMDDVAVGIADHIQELRPDLIIMCTHGHGGLRDVLYGSIAQQVVSHGTIPVLLIQPSGDGVPAAASCRKLLVPLDASPEHEPSLQSAAELARACQAALHLVLVVPTLRTLSGDQAGIGRLLPGTTSQVLEIARQEAEAHLRSHVQRLQATGIIVSAEITRGDPATKIVETALETKADMIVLGTHGKSGIDAFWQGSIAPKVSARSRVPLLLVPVTHQEASA